MLMSLGLCRIASNVQERRVWLFSSVGCIITFQSRPNQSCFPHCYYLRDELVNIIQTNYSIHSLLTSCACFHMQDGREHIQGSRIPHPALKKKKKEKFTQTGCRNSAGIQSCKSYFTSLSGRGHYGFPPRVKTLAWHTSVFMFIHRTSSGFCFFGGVKLVAICGSAPVSLRHTHPCFICQLWQIRRLLRSSLAPENGGLEPFRDVLMFSTPSPLPGWITVKSQSSILSTLVTSQVASDAGPM